MVSPWNLLEKSNEKPGVHLQWDLFFQVEFLRQGEKLCFQKQGTLWSPIVNQTVSLSCIHFMKYLLDL